MASSRGSSKTTGKAAAKAALQSDTGGAAVAAGGGGTSRGAVAGGARSGVAPAGGRELSSLRFAAVARELHEAGRSLGIEAPAFRSPPRAPGVRRAIRREPDGSATVSVALRGRPALAVVADMIDGMVTATRLAGLEAGLARDELWSAALGAFDQDERREGLVTARSAA